jgi:hypothetical protein
VRVGILELATEGYAAAGWETNAEALGWFTAIGKSQLDGALPMPAMNPVPAGARSDSGTVMDRMVELVLGAGAMHQQRGNPTAARSCLRLGRFYVQRELGAFRADESPAASAPAEPTPKPTTSTPAGRAMDPRALPPIDTARLAPAPAPESERAALERQIRELRARIEKLKSVMSQEGSRSAPDAAERRR